MCTVRDDGAVDVSRILTSSHPRRRRRVVIVGSTPGSKSEVKWLMVKRDKL